MVVDRLFFYGFGVRYNKGGWVVEEADTAEEARRLAVYHTGTCEIGSSGVLASPPRHLYFSELPAIPHRDSPSDVAEQLYGATNTQGTELTA